VPKIAASPGAPTVRIARDLSLQLANISLPIQTWPTIEWSATGRSLTPDVSETAAFVLGRST
jgi:hypothetical protein